MTTALLYFGTAALLLWIVHRLVVPISRKLWLPLLLLPLCFTGKALLTGAVYAPIDLPYQFEPWKSLREEYGINRSHNGLLSDLYCQIIPWKYAVRVAYANGQWPLWNPFSFAGDILGASAVSAPYEPVFLLSLLLPMANSLTYIAAMTLMLAGLLMFIFLREIDCSEIASLIGATAWMFSTFLVFWLEWPHTPTTMWLSLVLVGVRRIIRRRPRGMGILIVAFVMMLLSGHPESALHVVTVGLLWAAVELAIVRGRGIGRAAIEGIGAGAVALLTCAIFMLPIIEALPQSADHMFRREVYAKAKKSSPLAMARLEAQFLPFVFGTPHKLWPHDPKFLPPTESSWVGSVALALAIFGIWRSRQRAKWIALAFAVFGIINAIELAPFADLLGKLPLFDIALNSRLAFAAAFGFATLAALGTDALIQKGESGRLALASFGLALALGAICYQAWDRMLKWDLTVDFLRQEIALVIAPLLILAVTALAFRSRPLAIAVAVFILLAAQRTGEVGQMYPTLPAKAFYPPIPGLEVLPKSGQPYRIVGQGFMLTPNIATMYELQDIRGYQAMTFAPVRDTQPLWSTPQAVWFNRVDDLTDPLLSMFNVRYAFSWSSIPAPPGWVQRHQKGAIQILENERVLPRVFVPRRVRIGYSPDVVLDDMSRETDFGEQAWIYMRGETTPRETENPPGSVDVERSRLGEFEARTSMAADGWVVLSESAWKGWRAYVDGKPTKVYRANHTLLGIYVPKGEHRLRVVYWPHSFVVGRAISLITLVGIAAVFVWKRAFARAFTRSTSQRTSISSAQ